MEKTLLILGAGASKDFCKAFPTGLELIRDINSHFFTQKKTPTVDPIEGIYISALMNEIVRVLNTNEILLEKIKALLFNANSAFEYNDFRNISGKQISIDSFISQQIHEKKLEEQAKDIIKYCIYYFIKGAEAASENGFYFIESSWVQDLAQKLADFNDDDINKNLFFLSFNYDRIIERFLPECLNKSRRLINKNQSEISVNIQYVYGSLGPIDLVPVNFDNDLNKIYKDHFKYIQLADDRDNKVVSINNAEKFKNVHFLGFGYDETNLKKLHLQQFSQAQLLGTAYHFSKNEISQLVREHEICALNLSVSDYINQLEI